MKLLHSPVTSSLFVPNIVLRTSFSNTLSLCSFLSVRDQVSHSYRTAFRIMILFILNFTFIESRREDEKTLHIYSRKKLKVCNQFVFK
jgi:hypothetical protein